MTLQRTSTFWLCLIFDATSLPEPLLEGVEETLDTLG
jgi:hypothetical protein